MAAVYEEDSGEYEWVEEEEFVTEVSQAKFLFQNWL
jgi:isopentenyldiphosphate isomerase